MDTIRGNGAPNSLRLKPNATSRYPAMGDDMTEPRKTWIGVAVIGVATVVAYVIGGPIAGFGFVGVMVGWYLRAMASDLEF